MTLDCTPYDHARGADWRTEIADHPALAGLSEKRRAELLDMLTTSLPSVHVAAHCGVSADAVAKLRKAKNRALYRPRKERENVARREKRAAAGCTPKTPWQPATKPCACGRPGCVAERREGEDLGNWNDRRYAGASCAGWVGAHRKLEKMAEAKARAEADHAEPPPPPPAPTVEVPNRFLQALQLTHRRGEGEPTRETLHVWAAMHSGKPELSTVQCMWLRSPTFVRSAVPLDAA